MSVSASSSDSETHTLPALRLCQFYNEDFKVVMPVCTQQPREGELSERIDLYFLTKHKLKVPCNPGTSRDCLKNYTKIEERIVKRKKKENRGETAIEREKTDIVI